MSSALADLLHRLGDISLDRVRMWPLPGTATEADMLGVDRTEDKLCELVEGILVEKTVGYSESVMAGFIGTLLDQFVRPRNLGLISGASGPMRLRPGLVRLPDAAFVSWDRFPGRRIPEEPVIDLVPNLVVEVLSRDNTLGEMARKRGEYFEAGVLLVWEIDLKTRTVVVYTDPVHLTELGETDTLGGGHVLPGFSLPLSEYFSEMDRHG